MGAATAMNNTIEPDERAAAERAKRLKAKNLTLLIALVAFVVLVYFVSIVRMGGA